MYAEFINDGLRFLTQVQVICHTTAETKLCPPKRLNKRFVVNKNMIIQINSGG
jgi:hypothetical protein